MKIWGRHFHEFPGILVVRTLETARIYGFLGMRAPKFRFFPGNFYENLKFSRHFGSPGTKFPGILVDKTPRNAEIYGFHAFLGVKFGFFPGILVDGSRHLEKCHYTPGVHLQEYTGFPVPPGVHFGPQKRPLKIYLHLTAYMGVKSHQFLVEILQKMVTKFCKKFTKMLTQKNAVIKLLKQKHVDFFSKIFFIYFFFGRKFALDGLYSG